MNKQLQTPSTMKGLTETNDSVKRLPSKRTLQEFLVFPKSTKVTIEQSYDQVSEDLNEPGSHKKLQKEVSEEQQTKIVDCKQKEHDLSLELLSTRNTTIDSETRPPTKNLILLTQNSHNSA